MNLLTHLRALFAPKAQWWRQDCDGRFECWAVAEIATNKIVAGPYCMLGLAEMSAQLHHGDWGIIDKHRVVHLIERTP